VSTPERPPDEAFCMTCGPGSVVDLEPSASVLRCSSCGAVTEVPALPLFVVTGASGAGKTTVTAPLQRLLPECAVFEGDLILQVSALGWDMWRDTWLRIAHGVALSGRPTVLTHQRFAAWLRAHIDPTWDTSSLTPDEVAERVAAWIRPQLP
jgi:hypothetical protein